MLVRPFVRSFVRSFVRLFIRSFDHPLFCSFTPSFSRHHVGSVDRCVDRSFGRLSLLGCSIDTHWQNCFDFRQVNTWNHF